LADLRRSGIVTKVRQLANGRTIGGIPFTRGPLAHLLRNRFYIGEVVYKGKICPGEQPAILDRELFEAVQAKLSEQRTSGRLGGGISGTRTRVAKLARIGFERGFPSTAGRRGFHGAPWDSCT
jgi:hypothetical protein